MKSYRIEFAKSVYWVSKEPIKFIDPWNIKFKDGETAFWSELPPA